MRLMRWPDGERYLRPPQSFVVSLLSLVSTLLFSWTGGLLSHRNSLTQRFPQFPPRNLCSLVMLAVFSLVYAATDTVFCKVLISLGLTESRILPALLSSHSALSSYGLFATLCLSTNSGPDPGSCPASGAAWSSAMPPSLGRGRVINNKRTN